MNPQDLIDLGLVAAGEKLSEKMSRKKKMAIAYEHFRFVTPVVFERFQKALYLKTKKEDKFCVSYDKLIFIDLASYDKIPPPDCLLDLKKARDMRCFDKFEVAKVSTIVERKDPVVFGVIEGCEDKFFITQWDDDVSFEQIIGEDNNA